MTARGAVRRRPNPAHGHPYRRIVTTGSVQPLRCADCGTLRQNIGHLAVVPVIALVERFQGPAVEHRSWLPGGGEDWPGARA